MPTQTRKPAQKQAAAAAVRARREVRAEKVEVAPLEVPFRGQTFTIPRDRLGSARVFMRQKFIDQFGATGDAVSALLFELLGKEDSARFIDLCGPGDTVSGPVTEFIAALNKAANVPNSSASSGS